MTEYQALDRRPIAARRLGVSQRAASWLASRRVSPNAISVAGMVAGVAAGCTMALTSSASAWQQRTLWVAAALFIQARLIANMLDGMVAIQAHRASPVGELYNEVPDRVSDTAALIGAGYGASGAPILGFVAACLALFTAYVRTAGKAAGAPHDYRGPMAKQHRMAVLTAAAILSAVMPTAWSSFFLAKHLLDAALVIIIVGCVITSLRRLHGIAAHLRSGKAPRGVT